MKEIGKLWRITRRFYLTALVIVLFLSLLNSIYLCSYIGIVFKGVGVETAITEKLDVNKGAGVTPAHLTDAVMDNGMTLFGQLGTSIGIVILLLVRYFAYADVRTREMQMMWPIRMRKRILFDYVALLCILIIRWITEVGIVLGMGDHYNNTALRILNERGLDTSAFSDVAILSENKMYLVLMVVYLLYQVLFYTFLFLGMTAAKNPLLGFLVCFVWWGTFGLLADKLSYALWDLEKTASGILTSDTISLPSACLYSIQALLYYPDEVYSQIHAYGLFPQEDYAAYLGGISGICAILTLIWLILVMIFVIACISKRKELSKGRLMYSKGADSRFGVCFVILLYLFGSIIFSELTQLWGIVLLAVVVGIYLFLKKADVQKKWEVK